MSFFNAGLPNCSDNRDFPGVILCLFEYFDYRNIRKTTTGRLNVGNHATNIEFYSVYGATYIN